MQNQENRRSTGNNGNNNKNSNTRRSTSEDTPKWEAARAANAGNAIVNATVVDVATKDGRPRGLNVTLESGLASFIPGSELPKGVNQQGLVGQTIQVRVIEVNRRKGRLISSLKSVVDEERGSFISTLAEEQEVQATIVRFNKEIGYFADLGHGVDALLHLSQTALVDGKPEVLTIGQVVTARIRSVDAESGKVALTMRKPRPEQAHGNRRVERFQTRTSKLSQQRALVIPKATPVATAPAKPKGPRKLNTGTAKSKKAGFEVAFSSADGNPFEALAKWHADRTPAPEQTAPEAAEAPASTPAAE